jgi:hypothetical protein
MESENFTCQICGKSLDLKFSKTDENGKAVHPDCYADKVKRKSPLQFPKKASPLAGNHTDADDEEG